MWELNLRQLCILLNCCSVTKSCPTHCDPMHGSPPRSFVHGISQARILEWIAISYSKGSSWPRFRSRTSCIAGFLLPLGHWYTTPPPQDIDKTKPLHSSWNNHAQSNSEFVVLVSIWFICLNRKVTERGSVWPGARAGLLLRKLKEENCCSSTEGLADYFMVFLSSF